MNQNISAQLLSVSPMKKNEGAELNPVWARYCAEQMEDWLTWLNNVHVLSYVELCERFIELHPYYTPTRGKTFNDSMELLERMFLNHDYIHSLSDIGLRVWANSSIADFVNALEIYANRYPDLRTVRNFFIRNLAWTDRLYRFARAEIIADLRESGRDI